MRKQFEGNGQSGGGQGDGMRVPPAGNFVSGASEPQTSRLQVVNFGDAQFVARPAEQPYAGTEQADFFVRPRYSCRAG